MGGWRHGHAYGQYLLAHSSPLEIEGRGSEDQGSAPPFIPFCDRR